MNPQKKQFVYKFILLIIFLSCVTMLVINYYYQQKITTIHQETQKQLNIEKQKQLQIILKLKQINPMTYFLTKL